jgi:hypothetical protein
MYPVLKIIDEHSSYPSSLVFGERSLMACEHSWQNTHEGA